MKMRPVFLSLAIPFVLVLAGCNMPGVGGTPTKTTAAVPAIGQPTASGSESSATLSAPTASAAPASETPAPATETPAEPVGPTSTPAPAIVQIPAGNPVTISEIHMIDALQGWALGGREGAQDHVLVTEDGGLTWIDVTPPEPDVGAKAASGFFRDTQTAWVLYYPEEEPYLGPRPMPFAVWSTADRGATWERSDPLDLEFIGSRRDPPYLAFVDGQQGWIMARLGPAGMHRYPVYLLHTADGGATLEVMHDPYESAYLQSCAKSGMAFGDARVGLVTIENCPVDGARIHWTQDGGLSWSTEGVPPPSSTPDLFQDSFCASFSPWLFSPDQAALGVRCTLYDGDNPQTLSFLYRTQNGGATWESLPYPGGGLYFLDPQRGWALGREIYWTADGGQSWVKVKQVAWDGQFSFVDDDLGWAVARTEAEVALVRTQDGGATWQIIEPQVAP